LNVPPGGGQGEPVLYLDFDGVLHPYPMDELEIPEDILFQFVPLLEAMLEPFPQVKIVLSTTWAKNKTGPGALLYLPPGLQCRVIGATWDQETRLYRVPVEGRQWPLSRYEQIAADVAWRKPGA
jgi:HAD domain in Swiss Army Knife RNA repair proteins